MKLSFMPAGLRHWDDKLVKSPACESLVLSFFLDERPLRGVAGLVDWRLCGRLSRLITSGRCSGERGESMMMPAGPRLPFERVFLFGLGGASRLSEEEYTAHVTRIRDVLSRAGVEDYALQAPGRATGLIAARRAVELWSEQGESDSSEHATFIDSPGAHREMGDILAA